MAIKKDCITEFIQAWKSWDRTQKAKEIVANWNIRFAEAGYYRAVPSRASVQHHWHDMHVWCQEQFTPEHYAWAGDTFWFESDQDAMLFILRWS